MYCTQSPIKFLTFKSADFYPFSKSTSLLLCCVILELFFCSSSLVIQQREDQQDFVSMPKSSTWVFILLVPLALVFYLYRYLPSPAIVEQSQSSIYHISVQDIEGNDVSLSKFTGKVLLIVNVASKCGLTQGNYKELNILYAKYKTKGLEILAFPCNQFGSQEPGSNKEIKATICTTFKAEFPVFDKIEVNGENASPLYKFLKEQRGGLFGDSIKWNFAKFLVDRQGNVVDRYAPTTSPLEIENDIEKLLASA